MLLLPAGRRWTAGASPSRMSNETAEEPSRQLWGILGRVEPVASHESQVRAHVQQALRSGWSFWTLRRDPSGVASTCQDGRFLVRQPHANVKHARDLVKQQASTYWACAVTPPRPCYWTRTSPIAASRSESNCDLVRGAGLWSKPEQPSLPIPSFEPCA